MKSANKILLGIAAIFLVVIAMAAMDVHAQYNNQTETSLPDLETIDVGYGSTDYPLSVGDSIKEARFPITNAGTLAVSNFEYEISVYDTAVQDKSLCTTTGTYSGTIDPGVTIPSDSNIISISCPAFSYGGTYALRVRLDSNSRIAELNEGNNIAIKDFNVAGGSGGGGGTATNQTSGSSGGGGPVPIPIYPALSLDVSTDKYYYTAGETVKVSAVLTGRASQITDAIVSAYVYKPAYCPEGAACSPFASEKVELSLIGGVAQACEVQGDVVTCPTSTSYYYVGYYTPRDPGTYTVAGSAQIYAIVEGARQFSDAILHDDAKFEVIGKAIDVTDYDSVDLSISPTEQKTIVGEPVTYLLTITDKHKAYVCKSDPCPLYAIRPYTYNLEVFGLPYPSSFDRSSVTLDAGQSEQVRLTVYPSSTAIQQTVTAVAVQAQTTAQQTVTAVAEPAAPTARPIATSVETVKNENECIARGGAVMERAPPACLIKGKTYLIEEWQIGERAVAKVTARAIQTTPQYTGTAPQSAIAVKEGTQPVESAVVAIHPEYRDKTYQSTVRFTVKASQSDNDRNADKANAVLHVYYYRPPQPPEEPPDLPDDEEVTLTFEKGWNLINLPGEFVRTTESSSCGELGGFVYFPGRGYVKLDKSRDIIGDRFVEYFSTHSFWVRASQPCKITVEVSNFATYSGLELKSGWNFLGTTKDMVGETLNSIKGTCSIEKSYTFSTSENKWGRFGADNLITTPYKGIVVKTSGACTLGENSILPPPLPQE